MTLRDVLFILKRRLWLLVLIPALCALGVGFYAYRFMPDYYSSYATLYILVDEDSSGSDEGTSYSGLSYNMGVSQQIASDVSQLLASRRARLLVQDYMESASPLSYSVSSYVDDGSRILQLSVTSADPTIVADVANALSKVAAELAHNIMNVDSINVIDWAVDPTGPSGPNRRIFVLGAFAASFIAVSAAVLFAARADSRVRGVRDAERATGLTSVGKIPVFKMSTSNADDGRRARDRNARTIADARDAVQAAVTNLLFLRPDETSRVIAICSPEDEEGRSTIACLAAQMLAAYNNNVLLIEGDLHNRSLADLLGVHPEYGLASVINRDSTLLEAIRPTKQSRLYFLDIEPECTNATGLFSSNNFKYLLKTLRKRYDYIIIDTPPVTSFVYAAVIASEADSSLLIARESVTRKNALRAGMEQLRKAGVETGGVAINFASISRSDRRKEKKREKKRRAKEGKTDLAALAMMEDVVNVDPTSKHSSGAKGGQVPFKE